MSYFPIVIKLHDGSEKTCQTSVEIPQGIPFKVVRISPLKD